MQFQFRQSDQVGADELDLHRDAALDAARLELENLRLAGGDFFRGGLLGGLFGCETTERCQ